MLTLDTSVLLNYYQARTTGLSGGASAGRARTPVPTPPWDVTSSSKPLQAGELVRQSLAGRRFVDEQGAQLDVKGASADYRKLFAAYGALNRLAALAERAGAANLPALELGQLRRSFARGMKETQGYLAGLDLDAMRLVQGTTSSKATGASFSTGRAEYVTKPLTAGSRTTPSSAFDGDIAFDMRVANLNGTTTDVRLDLSEMGTGSRSITDVVLYLNDKLADAGVTTRFGIERTAGVPVTKEIGGKTVTLSTPPDQFGLKLVGGAGEAVSLSAPATAPAVYLAQASGRADPTAKTDSTRQELLKFQADGLNGTVLDPTARPGDANRSDERVFASALGGETAAVKAQQVGPDGSLYVLSEATGETAGQAIKGARDVVLTKYDSAGGVVYTRTLGAASEASGYGLAVDADGRVAIAGSVKGALNAGEINIDPNRTDSFVTLYDASGDEVWTYRAGAREDDEARAVAFADDGTVIVAGRTRSAMPGSDATAGGWDGYVQTLDTSATGKPVRTSSQVFGGAGDETVAGIAVSGDRLVVAGTDGPDAVVRSFDLSGGAPALTATRSLGALSGGNVAGVAFDGADVVVAGSTSAALNPGSATSSFAGGREAFAARLSADLSPSGADAIAYWGGTGDEVVTGMTVSGGRVYLAGSTTSDLPAGAGAGSKQAFVTRLDVATGASDWSQTYAGRDGVAAPTAIAVGATGASALDRLGLPSGAIAFAGARDPVTGKVDLTGSTLKVVGQTSARPGDQFYVQVNGGARRAVTLEANDTFATLAAKVNRALGFYGTAVVKRDVTGTREDKEILGNSSRLVLTSRNEDTRITLSAGGGDRNLLEALGLAEGEVRTLPTGVTETELVKQGEARTYGLSLASDLTLASKPEIKRASDQLQAALGVIRQAYRDLKTASEPKSPASANGPVPQYLSNQLANYQAALSRLTA